MADTYLTREGLKKLQDELQSLKKQRRELIDEVEKARAMGDLRENAEYHAARERLQHVTTRLSELEVKLVSVRIIDDLEVAPDEARLGVKVTLEDVRTKEKFSYVLVGPEESDPQNGKLSIASPLGKAILGKKKGEKFTLTLPKAIVPYYLVEVDKPGVL